MRLEIRELEKKESGRWEKWPECPVGSSFTMNKMQMMHAVVGAVMGPDLMFNGVNLARGAQSTGIIRAETGT